LAHRKLTKEEASWLTLVEVTIPKSFLQFLKDWANVTSQDVDLMMARELAELPERVIKNPAYYMNQEDIQTKYHLKDPVNQEDIQTKYHLKDPGEQEAKSL